MPKLSIITCTYNSAKYLEQNINSVLNQNFKDFEYVFIDGGSTDGTQDIILSYKNKLNIKLVSEKDNGIYDAMNKGIKMASGDVIGILNSDDFYDNNTVLSSVIEAFYDPKIDAVYGDISYFAKDINKVTRYWKAGGYKESNLNNGWTIPHPSLFLRKSVYDKCGVFNIDLKVAADYEFILRILKKNHIKVAYIPKIFVRMYDAGNSGRSIKQRINGWKDLKMAWVINNLKTPRFFIFRRLLYKISQFFIY